MTKLDEVLTQGLRINEIHEGDCLTLMKRIPDASVDMILCDLPYGTTACKWDTIIPFEPLWAEYERIINDTGTIVLTASQPFTSYLIMSNVGLFKYEWIWEKSNAGGAFDAKNKPMKKHENILIFSKASIPTNSLNKMRYFPQGVVETYKVKKDKKSERANYGGNRPSVKSEYIQTKTGYPTSILKFKNDRGLHPTQKPVALFEYLVKTYTNDGDTVLDNCIGSGTTAVACVNTNRNFIGIERDPEYVAIARQRVADAQKVVTDVE